MKIASRRVFLPFWIVLLRCFPLSLPVDAQPRGEIIGNILSGEQAYIGARVNAYRLLISDGRVIPIVECASIVEPNGNFRCGPVSSGTYVLVFESTNAWAPKEQSWDDLLQVQPPLFISYPAPLDSGVRDAIHLSAGQTATINIDSFAPSTGNATFETSSEASTAEFQLFSWIAGARIQVKAGAVALYNGAFTFHHLPSGYYLLVLNAREHEKVVEAQVFFNVDTDANAQFSIFPTEHFDVGGSVQASDPYVHPELVLTSMDPSDRRELAADVKEDGVFMVHDVIPGKYNIILKSSDGTYASGVALGERDLEDFQIDVESDIRNLRVTASKGNALLIGTVRPSQCNVAGGVVLEDMKRRTEIVSSVDKNGQFHFANLPESEYRASAWHDIAQVPFKNENLLDQFSEESLYFAIDGRSLVKDVTLDCIHLNQP